MLAKCWSLKFTVWNPSSYTSLIFSPMMIFWKSISECSTSTFLCWKTLLSVFTSSSATELCLPKIFDPPSHIWIFFDHFIDNFLFRVMEIMEGFFNMEWFLVSSEWRELWMREELFKIAELVSLFIFDNINLILIFQCLLVLFIISLQEWEDSLDVVLLQELWEVEHHHLLIFDAVNLENVIQH